MLRCIKCGRRPASTSSTSNCWGAFHFTMRGDMGEVFSILFFSSLSRAREEERLICWYIVYYGILGWFLDCLPTPSRLRAGKQSAGSRLSVRAGLSHKARTVSLSIKTDYVKDTPCISNPKIFQEKKNICLLESFSPCSGSLYRCPHPEL